MDRLEEFPGTLKAVQLLPQQRFGIAIVVGIPLR